MREMVLGASLYGCTTNRVHSQTKTRASFRFSKNARENSREFCVFGRFSLFREFNREFSKWSFAEKCVSFQSGYASFAEKCVSFGKLAHVLTKSEGVSVPRFNDFLKKARVLKTEKSRSKLAHFSEILTASFCTGLSF